MYEWNIFYGTFVRGVQNFLKNFKVFNPIQAKMK